MRRFGVTIGDLCTLIGLCALGFTVLLQAGSSWLWFVSPIGWTLAIVAGIGAVYAPNERRVSWLVFAAVNIFFLVFRRYGLEGYAYDWQRVTFLWFAMITAGIVALVAKIRSRRQTLNVNPSTELTPPGRRFFQDTPSVLARLAVYGVWIYALLWLACWSPLGGVTLALYSAWAIMILLLIAVVLSRGRTQAVCVTALLLGGIYLSLQTVDVDRNWFDSGLNATAPLAKVRRWMPPVFPEFPPYSEGIRKMNRRVEMLLSEHASVDCPPGTSLEQFLEKIHRLNFPKYPSDRIKTQIIEPIDKDPDARPITVLMSMHDVPVRQILDEAMKQTNHSYWLVEGELIVARNVWDNTEDFAESLQLLNHEPSRDPYFCIGECFVAILAAGIGAILGGTIYDRATQ